MISTQFDLWSYFAPSTPSAATIPPGAPVGRRLWANRWLSVSIVRGTLAQPHSTILQLTVSGMESDSHMSSVYTFGAHAIRGLFDDLPHTSTIRISAAPSAARAIIVEIRSHAARSYTWMHIKDFAWYSEPAVKRPARHMRWTCDEQAYNDACAHAHATQQQAIAAKTIRVALTVPHARVNQPDSRS